MQAGRLAPCPACALKAQINWHCDPGSAKHVGGWVVVFKPLVQFFSLKALIGTI
jgi:hypothetical protein